MRDLKDWCEKNNVEWHTTTLETLENKTALEKLWEEHEVLQQQINVLRGMCSVVAGIKIYEDYDFITDRRTIYHSSPDFNSMEKEEIIRNVRLVLKEMENI